MPACVLALGNGAVQRVSCVSVAKHPHFQTRLAHGQLKPQRAAEPWWGLPVPLCRPGDVLCVCNRFSPNSADEQRSQLLPRRCWGVPLEGRASSPIRGIRAFARGQVQCGYPLHWGAPATHTPPACNSFTDGFGGAPPEKGPACR